MAKASIVIILSFFFQLAWLKSITTYIKHQFIIYSARLPWGELLYVTIHVNWSSNVRLALSLWNINWFIQFIDKINSTLLADGVVLVDPEYLKERKVYAHVLAAFRYGREDLDVLGLTFRKDLFLASCQVRPDVTLLNSILSRLMKEQLPANRPPCTKHLLHV